VKAITTWHRLEPVARTDDLNVGLRAELADPLWMLGRQWQFGELTGEDAGSPIEAVVTVETAPIDRFHAGPVTTGAAGRAQDVEPALPLEVLVERRPTLGSPSDCRIRIDAGQHFLRLLSMHGAPTQRQRFVDEFRLDLVAFGVLPDGVDDVAPRSMMGIVGNAVPDGRQLAERLLEHRGTAAVLTSLPATPEVASTLAGRVLRAANDYLTWWENFVSEPGATSDSWIPQRLEYSFALQATLSDGPVVLRADDYRGGHLDWSEFDADSRAQLGTPTVANAPTTIVRRTIPTRAFYAGMPAERFWEFEDATVHFGGGSVARTDLAHLLLDEFALSYGNDWYVVPMRMNVGSLCAVREVLVIDTFGEQTVVPAAAAIGSSSWTMFGLTPRPASAQRVNHLTVLPNVVGTSQQGDPVEEVTWFRDEMANVVWAVEHRTESPLGGSVDRARAGASRPARQPVATDVGDAELIYRLNSTVPEHWFPLVPVRPAGAQPGVVRLQLRPIERIDASGSSATEQPVGRFLNASSPMVVEEEEVPRDGLSTTAHWQLTRGGDGRYHLWLSNQSRVGRGEGSSGLIFDISRPVG
jgi:hypothetical protein